MQADMMKIYENEKFELYVGTGSKNSGLISFSPADADGNAINDTFSVSSAPCTLSDFSGEIRKYAAWEDIGKGHTRPGGKSMLWDEGCEHWCACHPARSTRVQYILSGEVYVFTGEETQTISVQPGDYLAVVRGEVVLDVHERNNRQVVNLFVEEIATRRTIKVLSTKDSVIFVITATPV